jgi:hypothetical protein
LTSLLQIAARDLTPAEARGMSDDELFGTRPRGAPAMGRRRGGERSTERASPALAADLADDSSDEETRPPASRSGGWAGEDAAGAPASSSGWAAGGPAEGVARDFDDDESPVRPSRAGGFGGTPGGSASRRRMDSASKHDALEARDVPSGADIPEIPTSFRDSRALEDGAYADDAAAGGFDERTHVRSIDELDRATERMQFATSANDDDDAYGDGVESDPLGAHGTRGAVDVSLLASALVPRAFLEEEGDEEWVPERLWNAVKHDLRREREEAERDENENENEYENGFERGGDVFEDAVGGALGAADFASPAKTGAAVEAKKRKGLLGRVRKKLGKMAGM